MSLVVQADRQKTSQLVAQNKQGYNRYLHFSSKTQHEEMLLDFSRYFTLFFNRWFEPHCPCVFNNNSEHQCGSYVQVDSNQNYPDKSPSHLFEFTQPEITLCCKTLQICRTNQTSVHYNVSKPVLLPQVPVSPREVAASRSHLWLNSRGWCNGRNASLLLYLVVEDGLECKGQLCEETDGIYNMQLNLIYSSRPGSWGVLKSLSM